MLKTKSFLCGDFGAGTLKLAEFEPGEDGSLRLLHYGVRQLGSTGGQESDMPSLQLAALKDLLASGNFTSREINICAPGHSVFSKFVKLPPVDTAKVTQIIQYEAQQNVPFPLEDVVWDYQILGAAASGELEVLLVAIKSDVVEELFTVSDGAGMRLQLVDVSPAALCNAFRFNYGDSEGCTMLLDIGAKTSNLLFFEQGKVFSRSINIGANAITQDFASTAGLSFAEADQIKIAEGFVGLGGAYAEPDNPHQAAISKIARQVMTRLHIQMNSTIQFYRGQQGGSAPTRLYLAGGASMMPYTAQFFAEKLNLEVEYFNPFQNIEIEEDVDLDELSTVAHSFGELVGLSIRKLAQCPVELNLMPKSHLKRERFNQKKPYFIATIFSLVLVVLAYGWFYDRLGATKRANLEQLNQKMAPLKSRESQLKSALTQLVQADYLNADLYSGLVHDRMYWSSILTNLRHVFRTYEIKTTVTNATSTNRTGVWIEEINPYLPQAQAAAANAAEKMFNVQAPGAAQQAPQLAQPVDLYYIDLKCRALNLMATAADANNNFSFGLAQDLKTNAMFNAAATDLLEVEPVEETATNYAFGIRLQLNRPIRVH